MAIATADPASSTNPQPPLDLPQAPEIEIQRGALSRALCRAGKITDSRSVVEALRSVRIAADKGRVWLEAANAQSTVQIELPATAHANAQGLVSPGRLKTVISAFGWDATIALRPGERTFEVRHTSTHFTLPAGNLGDWPNAPERARGQLVVTATRRQLGEPLAAAARHSLANPSARPALTALLLTSDDASQRVVATDAFRLIVIPLPGGQRDFRALLPARELQDAITRGYDEQEEVQITLDGPSKHATITSASETWTLRLLDDNFPSWETLIPPDEQASARATVAREALLAAATAANKASIPGAAMQIALSHGELRLWTRAQRAGDDDGEVTDRVPATVTLDGSQAVVQINPSYLLDAVLGLTEDTVELLLTGEHRAIVLRSGERCALVMPMRL
jgi:DNA polymerase III subunit beta